MAKLTLLLETGYLILMPRQAVNNDISGYFLGVSFQL